MRLFATFSLIAAIALPVFAMPVFAQTVFAQTDAPAPRIVALGDAMRMDDLLAIMRDEGVAYGKTLDDEMLSGRGGARWAATVEMIYDPATLRARFDAAFAAELAQSAQLAEIEAFYASTVGSSALMLEIEARRALLDPAVEDAAKLAFADLEAGGGARYDRLTRFVEANDLIESNVMGALNANLGFYRGMAEGGGVMGEMTEQDMLADVWAQEADVRIDTAEWLYPYLTMAYQPMSDADFDAYIAFSESDAGQKLNAALFAAFDAVFAPVSVDLGRAVAKQLAGDDI